MITPTVFRALKNLTAWLVALSCWLLLNFISCCQHCYPSSLGHSLITVWQTLSTGFLPVIHLSPCLAHRRCCDQRRISESPRHAIFVFILLYSTWASLLASAKVKNQASTNDEICLGRSPGWPTPQRNFMDCSPWGKAKKSESAAGDFLIILWSMNWLTACYIPTIQKYSIIHTYTFFFPILPWWKYLRGWLIVPCVAFTILLVSSIFGLPF